MTAQEIIAILSNVPPEMVVVVPKGKYGFGEVESADLGHFYATAGNFEADQGDDDGDHNNAVLLRG
jgi:hypothetical protein